LLILRTRICRSVLNKSSKDALLENTSEDDALIGSSPARPVAKRKIGQSSFLNKKYNLRSQTRKRIGTMRSKV
jgi:hypothetical protein